MLLGIDHIVIAVHDPDAATEELRERVGLEPGGGGRHPRYGTFNRLVWLGDSYLELMGVEDPELTRQRGIGAATLALLERGEQGFASFAIATDDIAADVAALQAAGLPYEDPKPGERERPDGEVVRWRTAITDGAGVDGLPFLIEHVYAGPEWGDAARRARAAAVHPLGGRATLARLELAVADPAAAARRYASPGLEARFDPSGGVDFPIGPTLLRFVRARAEALSSAIVIAVSDGRPRSVDALGVRFEVEVPRPT